MAAGIIGSVLLAVIGYLAQISIFPALGGVAVGPNMVLALAVVFGMIYGPWPALAMGLFGGLMVDFMAGGAIGLSCFIPVIAGFLLGVLKGELNSRHFLWAMIFAAIANFMNDFWLMLTMYFARVNVFIGWGTLLRSIFSAVETGIAAGLVFLIVSRLLSIGEKRSGLPYLERY